MAKFENKDEFDAWVKTNLQKEDEARKEAHDKKWDNLGNFNTPEDVPDLPITTEENWKNFYVPRLIEAGAISKKDLKDGHYYIGNHRRGRIAKWVESENRFHYWREKFGKCYIDKCEHFEDYSHFAVFVPVSESTKADFDYTDKNPN